MLILLQVLSDGLVDAPPGASAEASPKTLRACRGARSALAPARGRCATGGALRTMLQVRGPKFRFEWPAVHVAAAAHAKDTAL